MIIYVTKKMKTQNKYFLYKIWNISKKKAYHWQTQASFLREAMYVSLVGQIIIDQNCQVYMSSHKFVLSRYIFCDIMVCCSGPLSQACYFPLPCILQINTGQEVVMMASFPYLYNIMRIFRDKCPVRLDWKLGVLQYEVHWNHLNTQW